MVVVVAESGQPFRACSAVPCPVSLSTELRQGVNIEEEMKLMKWDYYLKLMDTVLIATNRSNPGWRRA